MDLPVPAQPQNAIGGMQQRLGRRTAQRHQHLRLGQFDLPLDERAADFGFVRRWCAVSRRPPGNDVGDIGRCPVETDRRKYTVEQLSRPADERQPFDVLVAPGRLADQHQVGFGIAVGEDHLLGREFQIAAVESLHGHSQFVERRGRRRQLARQRGLRFIRHRGLRLRARAGRWSGGALRVRRIGESRASCVATSGALRRLARTGRRRFLRSARRRRLPHRRQADRPERSGFRGRGDHAASFGDRSACGVCRTGKAQDEGMRGSCTRKNSQRGVKSVRANSKIAVSRGSTLPSMKRSRSYGSKSRLYWPKALDMIWSVFSRRWSNDKPSPKTLACAVSPAIRTRTRSRIGRRRFAISSPDAARWWRDCRLRCHRRVRRPRGSPSSPGWPSRAPPR